MNNLAGIGSGPHGRNRAMSVASLTKRAASSDSTTQRATAAPGSDPAGSRTTPSSTGPNSRISNSAGSSRHSFSYLVIAVGLVAAALVFAFHVQGRDTLKSADESNSAVVALTAMLDQETGVRGFLYTGQEQFLEPYLTGRLAYATARLQVAQAAAGDSVTANLAAAEDNAARAWQTAAARNIAARQVGNVSHENQVLQAEAGKQQMDRFRAVNTQLRNRLDQRRNARLSEASTVSTIAVVLLAGLLALFGFLWLRRNSRRALSASEQEVAYRVSQQKFTDLIQAVDGETEAHQLVQRHLQRVVPGAIATVLTRNNSDNRLEAATDVAPDSVLRHALIDAEPRSCFAIRLGRAHEDGPGCDELISCNVCSHGGGAANCQPLLVGGKVIGSVLIERLRPLEENERRSVAETVVQAAPVLANLRTIAIAESRAATDALTGLPNRRAMQDSLKRMAAHAGRSAQPLAAIAFDLDNFKTINDRYGHDVGDAALCAVAECLRENIRESDFASRTGGEEFLVLCPDIDLDGALTLAEKLRDALSREAIPQLHEPVTASFGVALIPNHAGTADTLLRRADRASYIAKGLGRNRVEAAAEESVSAVRRLAGA
jgi:diguanylate cyclase (GGDEF)-like protein